MHPPPGPRTRKREAVRCVVPRPKRRPAPAHEAGERRCCCRRCGVACVRVPRPNAERQRRSGVSRAVVPRSKCSPDRHEVYVRCVVLRPKRAGCERPNSADCVCVTSPRPWSSAAFRAVRAYLEAYPATGNEPLFRTGPARHLTRRRLHKIVDRYTLALRLPRGVHTLRHSAATRWLNRGVNLQFVRTMLGHERLPARLPSAAVQPDGLAAARIPPGGRRRTSCPTSRINLTHLPRT